MSWKIPDMPSEEEWEKRDLDLFNKDKKEWMNSMGMEILDIDQQMTIITKSAKEIIVNVYSNDCYDVAAMKIRNSIEGKEFLNIDHSRSDQKLLNR